MVKKSQVVFCISLLLVCVKVNAQQARLTLIDTSNLYQSLYDVRLLNDSICYAVGELGARAIINFNTNTISYQHDTNKADIVELVQKHDSFVVPPSFEAKPNRSQYTSYYYNGTMYSAYFDKRILAPQAVVPKTRLYTTKDKQVRSRKFWASTIWQFFEHEQALYCLKYNIFGTRFLQLSEGRFTLAQKHSRYLLHKASINASEQAFCGATNFKLKTGVLIYNNKTYKLPSSGMLWDCVILPSAIVCAGSNGKVYIFHKHNEQWQILDAKVPHHFYDVVAVSDKKVVLVGRAGVCGVLEM
jgi:hypothetical protein